MTTTISDPEKILALSQTLPCTPKDDPNARELYTQGFCHVFAIANVMRWGGGFVVFENPEEPYAYDEDDDSTIASIWHVMSVHNTENGLIARDITGDVSLENAKDHICTLFRCEDFSVSQWTTEHLDDILEHTDLAEDLFDKNPDFCPLCGFCDNDIAEAIANAITQTPPGKT